MQILILESDDKLTFLNSIKLAQIMLLIGDHKCSGSIINYFETTSTAISMIKPNDNLAMIGPFKALMKM